METGNLVCPLCGQANQCLADTQDIASCWCFGVDVSRHSLARVPPDQIDRSCLCPRCAAGDTPWQNRPFAEAD